MGKMLCQWSLESADTPMSKTHHSEKKYLFGYDRRHLIVLEILSEW